MRRSDGQCPGMTAVRDVRSMEPVEPVGRLDLAVAKLAAVDGAGALEYLAAAAEWTVYTARTAVGGGRIGAVGGCVRTAVF